MINLFLAILLGNFDDSRQFISKQSAFHEFKRLNRKKVPLPIALVIVLGDLGEYIWDNVLNDENIDQSQLIIEPQPEREIIVDEKEVKLKRTVTFQNDLSEEPEEIPKLNTEHLRSQETFEKMINDDKDLNQNITLKDHPASCKADFNDPIMNSLILNQIREIPSNQQDGEAYDMALNKSKRQESDQSKGNDMHDQHVRLFQNFLEVEGKYPLKFFNDYCIYFIILENKEDYFWSDHDEEDHDDIEEQKQDIANEVSSKFIKSISKSIKPVRVH